MAIAHHKGTLRIESEFASGDHLGNGVKTNLSHITRTSVESKLAGKGDGLDLGLNLDFSLESCTEESAYEEYSSEVSDSDEFDDDESRLTDVSTPRTSSNTVPKFQLTSSSCFAKQDSTSLNKKCASASKIYSDSAPFELEDRIRCMSLNEVRSSRTGPDRPTRKNMSFTNDQVAKIERDNELLLRKIMAQQKPLKSRQQPVQPKLSSSAINRRRFQRKVEEDNLLLLRRLQQAKPCVINTNKISGCRTTHF